MNISGIEKITKVIRIPKNLDDKAMEIIYDEGFENMSKGYEYLIGIAIEIHQNKIRLESDPELESKIKEEFQEMIEKITNEEAMFEEVKKIPQNKIKALKMLFSIEEDRRWKSKNSN